MNTGPTLKHDGTAAETTINRCTKFPPSFCYRETISLAKNLPTSVVSCETHHPSRRCFLSHLPEVGIPDNDSVSCKQSSYQSSFCGHICRCLSHSHMAEFGYTNTLRVCPPSRSCHSSFRSVYTIWNAYRYLIRTVQHSTTQPY